MSGTATVSYEAYVGAAWGRTGPTGRLTPPGGRRFREALTVDGRFARQCLLVAGPGGDEIREPGRLARLATALLDEDGPFRARDDWYEAVVTVGFWLTAPGLTNVKFTFEQPHEARGRNPGGIKEFS